MFSLRTLQKCLVADEFVLPIYVQSLELFYKTKRGAILSLFLLRKRGITSFQIIKHKKLFVAIILEIILKWNERRYVLFVSARKSNMLPS